MHGYALVANGVKFVQCTHFVKGAFLHNAEPDALNVEPDINYVHAKMARAGLGLSVRDLAEAAALDKATIVRFEAGAKTRQTTVAKIRSALEDLGATFVDVHDESNATVHVSLKQKLD